MEGPTILANSGEGDSQANGAAEMAVQALWGEVRMPRQGLESRLRIQMSSTHPIVSWIGWSSMLPMSIYENEGERVLS